MGVTAVRAFPDDRRVVGGHAGVGEMLHDSRLDVEFGREAVIPNLLPDVLPGDAIRGIGVPGRFLVHGPLLGAPGRLELLNQIAGRDHFDAEAADEFEGATIDAGNVRIAVAGTVFHGDALSPVHQRFDSLFEFLPAQIDGRVVPRQMLECGRFDAVAQLLRFARGRDEISPTAGAVRLGGARHAGRQDVDLPEIVQEPAVETMFAERGLHGGEVECHFS